MTQAVTQCRACYKSLQQDIRFVDNSRDAATQINPDSHSVSQQLVAASSGLFVTITLKYCTCDLHDKLYLWISYTLSALRNASVFTEIYPGYTALQNNAKIAKVKRTEARFKMLWTSRAKPETCLSVINMGQD